MSKNSFITICPRCGTHAFEKLSSYAHCMECLYSEDHHFDMETAYHQVKRIERQLDDATIFKFPIKSKKAKGEAS